MGGPVVKWGPFLTMALKMPAYGFRYYKAALSEPHAPASGDF